MYVLVHSLYHDIIIHNFQSHREQYENHVLGRGTWVVQLVQWPTSAQVMISWFVSLSPTSGSVLTAQSLEPASDSVSPSLSAPPPLTLCLSVSKINIKKFLKRKKEYSSRGTWIEKCPRGFHQAAATQNPWAQHSEAHSKQ